MYISISIIAKLEFHYSLPLFHLLLLLCPSEILAELAVNIQNPPSSPFLPETNNLLYSGPAINAMKR